MPRIEDYTTRITRPADESDLQELRERVNRIDRADDISEWRRELGSLTSRVAYAKTRAERNNIVRSIHDLIKRMH